MRYSKGEQNTICDEVNLGSPPFPGQPCLVDTFRDPWNVAANWRWNPANNVVNEFVVGGNHFTFDFITPTADHQPARIHAARQSRCRKSFAVGNLRTLNTLQVVNNTELQPRRAQLQARAQRAAADARGHPRVGERQQRHADVELQHRQRNTVDPTAFGLPANIQTGQRSAGARIEHQFPARPRRTDHAGLRLDRQRATPRAARRSSSRRRIRRSTSSCRTPGSRPRTSPSTSVCAGKRSCRPATTDGLIRRPNQRVAVGEAPSNALTWIDAPLYDDDLNNFAPSVGFAWDPTGTRQAGHSRQLSAGLRPHQHVRDLVGDPAEHSGHHDRRDQHVVRHGRRAARQRRRRCSRRSRRSTPDADRSPARTMRVMDTEFESPLTHGWAINYQREVFKGNAVRGRVHRPARREPLRRLRREPGRDLQQRLPRCVQHRQGGRREPADEPAARPGHAAARPARPDRQFVRRLFASNLQQNSVAALAGALGSRLQGGRTLAELSGLGPYFFYPYPQFLGSGSNAALSVIDSEDWSRYHALRAEARAALPRRCRLPARLHASRSRRTPARSIRRSRSSAPALRSRRPARRSTSTIAR